MSFSAARYGLLPDKLGARPVRYNPSRMEAVQTCDACGAALNGRKVEGMGEVSLLQCDCGLVTTSPRPTVAEIAKYYPPTYYSYTAATLSPARRVVDKLKEYKGGYPTRDGLLARAFWRAAAALLQNIYILHLPTQGKNQRLLEIGCGSGLNLLWAKSHGWKVYGLELGEEAVAEAHRRGLSEVKREDVENADFPTGFFDAVLVHHTLEHLYSPAAAIRRSHELLRAEGTLLIAVPKFDSWPRHVSGEFWAHLDLPRHLHHFTQPVLLKMTMDAGFRIREVRLSSKPIGLYFTLRTLKRSGELKRLLTRPQGTLSDVMLIVAEK